MYEAAPTEQSEREAFERWALSEEGGWWSEAVSLKTTGYYFAPAVQKQWIGWQARAALSAQAQPRSTSPEPADVAATIERCAKIIEATPSHKWVPGSDQFGNPCPAKVVTQRSDYAAAVRAALAGRAA